MIKGIVYNNQAQANTLKLRLRNRVKHLFKGAELEWTFTITHPTTGDVAVIINEDAKYLDEVYEELNPNERNNIVELDPSWFPQNEI